MHARAASDDGAVSHHEVQPLIEPLLDTLWSAALQFCLHPAKQSTSSPAPDPLQPLPSVCKTFDRVAMVHRTPAIVRTSCRAGSSYPSSPGHTGKGRAASLIAWCPVHVVSRGGHAAPAMIHKYTPVHASPCNDQEAKFSS